MSNEYVKETKALKDKTDNETKLELIISIVKTRNDLQIAHNNYEYAEGNLIDYFLYEIKANQSKLDHLLKKAKELNMEMELVDVLALKGKKVV